MEPIAIVERRLIRRKGVAVAQVRVQWSNASFDETTWLDWTDLKARFPDFHECQT